jgi:predicted CoA-substrate-specific enzyme activase
MIKLGLDIGSTTVKCVVLDGDNNIIYTEYKRHFSKISESVLEMLENLTENIKNNEDIKVCISGSAGMGIASSLDIPFVQEVYATRMAIKHFLPSTDTVIELGGEDAKILFLTDGLEVRMNGSCAGGTGAFIDQMATLLNIKLEDINDVAENSSKIYTIASRCGVFAKSDIQPLLNQGASKSDISASIFYAVVNQTIGGLAQGREIQGNVVYLGGPLTYFPNLRKAFDNTLKLKGTCPENSLYYVAIGSSLYNTDKKISIFDLKNKIKNYQSCDNYSCCKPLFADKTEYDNFIKRHKENSEKIKYIDKPQGDLFLGIDAGSTTVKAVVINENGDILFSKYASNSGNPVVIIKDYLEEFYAKYPNTKISSSAVTGYGEEIIKNAFKIDFGIVETVAHYTAAKKYQPKVDFIIDIGGQDIKCFKIKNGVIDNIFLNEACSSGCGSFLQTFAGALGYKMEDFAKIGILANKPVDLGSRCTVFMNSSVKQAQKEGASVENISAGLSISVVKNAIYKVIRASKAEGLGANIVVQGGTFLNNAVLRAFEQEVGVNVIRPDIAGLMGAYGAALYSQQKRKTSSTVITEKELKDFTHEAKAITCKSCTNNCKLTVNTFDNGRKFIGGNRCERAFNKDIKIEHYNLYDYKNKLLDEYKNKETKVTRETIGFPMGLNFYELLPFWHTLFTELGFKVVVSPNSTRKIYMKGQHTIPSDTVCFPAKLLHGHIEELLENNLDAIFYPCMTYNLDEGLGDNHYNCPVVAYYPEVLNANTKSLKDIKFIYDYIGIHRPKDFIIKFHKILENNFGSIPIKDVKNAIVLAYREHDNFLAKVRKKGEEYLKIADEKGLHKIILAGRPYHLDDEVNHGIDKLVCSCGAVVLTEDSISHLVGKFPTKVLNQWTYHSRLYAAAKYIAQSNDKKLNMVQLVSFGCGVDAITTDEAREILEQKGKIYTQIKIDEISNLGAVKIRLRSLFAAIE